jgi:hypothetical protein
MDFSHLHFPYRGRVRWLTEQEGGLRRAPPPAADGFAQVAFVLPNSFSDGLASFVLRGFDETLMESSAEGRWLFLEADEATGPFAVDSGSELVICHGPKHVARFVVEHVVAE